MTVSLKIHLIKKIKEYAMMMDKSIEKNSVVSNRYYQGAFNAVVDVLETEGHVVVVEQDCVCDTSFIYHKILSVSVDCHYVVYNTI